MSVESHGASSTDTIQISVSPYTPGSITLRGGLSLELNRGNDRVFIKGPTIGINGTTDIDTGAGNDEVEISFDFNNPAPSSTLRLNGNLDIDTGSGKDWVRILDQRKLNQVEVTGKVHIDTGSQNDIVQIFGAKFGHKFLVELGNSDTDPSPLASADVLSLGNTDIRGLSQIESDGLAHVYVFAAEATLQPMRFRSNAFFSLGSGFVDMSFVYDTSKVIFDKQQVFQGVTSAIMVKYGSSVVFNPQKRKLFNANLN